ncbi:MAG: DUF6431 domain-containing protein [Anaeroplasma bactoclasticum]|nr:DUF6431 domain-containing protein [Anaeroplasma bactoclasticum]
MIVLNIQKIKSNFEKKLQIYEKSLNFNHLECPCCHSNEYIRWGFYERGVIYKKNHKIFQEIIVIQRIKCKSCNRTHALLPFGIIPYRQLTDEVIIDMITGNENEELYFSLDTVQKIKKQFKKHFLPYLITFLNTTNLQVIMNQLQYEKEKILVRFIKETKRCFMQIKLGQLMLCPL